MLLPMTSTATPPTVRRPLHLAGRQRRDWVSLIARLILAGVWLVAGGLKLPNLEASVLAVRGYQILPYEMAVVVGYLLPIVEVILGLLLLLGLFTRPAAVLSGLIMVAFIIGIAQAWARGLAIDCGCFGGGGEISLAEAQAKYPVDIARDIGLLLLASWLAWRPKSPFSLDRALFGDADELIDPDSPDEQDSFSPELTVKEDATR
mgnify:CR=1 FL=1